MQETVRSLPQLLKGRRIILGVCGSVAIYKSLEILRILQKWGADVRVVMSKGAQEFITPLLFESLSHHQVLRAESQSWSENPHNHIEIANWGELFLVAPCSANTLNKIAHGIADNVLLESFLAFDGKKIIAPSANTKMLENPASVESLRILEQRDILVIQTQSKELACGSVGNGALAEPLEIAFEVVRTFLQESFWLGKSLCVSGGGSSEALDSVRFLSNFSSGKMGASLALGAYFLGAQVCFITSQMPFILPLGIKIQRVESTQEYFEAIQHWQNAQTQLKDSYLFMAAAISDYVPKNPLKKSEQKKFKKSEIGAEWNLALRENLDILATISKEQKTIGFKLESQNGIESAKSALRAKNLHAICLNTISEAHNPLSSQNNQVFWIQPKLVKDLGMCDKFSLALKILQQAKEL